MEGWTDRGRRGRVCRMGFEGEGGRDREAGRVGT